MLVHTDPFQVFDRLARHSFGSGFSRPLGLPMDAYRSADEFAVAFDLPGVEPGSIDVRVDRNVLTVKAERPQNLDEDAEVRVTERVHGVFTRRLVLADNLDTERVQANYNDGVLTLRIPVAEQSKPRRIAVTSGQPQQLTTAGQTGETPGQESNTATKEAA